MKDKERAALEELCEKWDLIDREGSGSDAIFGACADEIREILKGNLEISDQGLPPMTGCLRFAAGGHHTKKRNCPACREIGSLAPEWTT